MSNLEWLDDIILVALLKVLIHLTQIVAPLVPVTELANLTNAKSARGMGEH